MTREEFIIDSFETMIQSMLTISMPAPKKHVLELIIQTYNSEPILQDSFDYFPNERWYYKKFIRKGTIKETFDDKINYNTPKMKGLYFVGETHFNPLTDEKYYWVKIGKAANLAERMRTYNTHNPMLFRIDYSSEYEKEEYYHVKLIEKAIARCNHNEEWFLVDRETYLGMCEKGFSYFN